MSIALRRLTTIATHLRRPAVDQVQSFKLGSSLSSQITPEMSSNAKELVDKAIKENKNLMFGKTYCPVRKCSMPLRGKDHTDTRKYCKTAKKILEQAGDLTEFE